MSASATKRQRANTNGDAATSTPVSVKTSTSASSISQTDNLSSILDTFSALELRELFQSAAQKHGDIAASIVNRRNATIHAEKQKIVNFDHYSKSVWHELQQGGGLSGSRQYDLGLDVGASIAKTIATILKQTPNHASFGTKRSALETLRKICKSFIIAGHTTFGSEVIKQLYTEGEPQEKSMLAIVVGMSEEEKVEMSAHREWIEKVEELIELGKDHDLYDNLKLMLSLLGQGSDDEEGSSADKEGEKDEQSESSQELGYAGFPEDVLKTGLPRRNMCRGCGCGDPRCSSCWGDYFTSCDHC